MYVFISTSPTQWEHLKEHGQRENQRETSGCVSKDNPDSLSHLHCYLPLPTRPLELYDSLNVCVWHPFTVHEHPHYRAWTSPLPCRLPEKVVLHFLSEWLNPSDMVQLPIHLRGKKKERNMVCVDVGVWVCAQWQTLHTQNPYTGRRHISYKTKWPLGRDGNVNALCALCMTVLSALSKHSLRHPWGFDYNTHASLGQSLWRKH